MVSKKGESAFLNRHDDHTKIPKRIRETLTAMLKEGRDRWEYNDDFRKLTKLSVVQLKEYRRFFAKHLIWAPPENSSRDRKLVWCACTTQADKFSKVPNASRYSPEDDQE